MVQLEKNFQTRESITTVQHVLQVTPRCSCENNTRCVGWKKKGVLFKDDIMIYVEKKRNGQLLKPIRAGWQDQIQKL